MVVQAEVLGSGEGARLEAVRRYDILDTPPDGAFDRVTALAARFLDVPISTITIVDEDRIWFKSARGLDGVAQIDRGPGLCASAILQQAPYVVTDAVTDPRTLNNPLVRGELGLRFYLAVPLRSSDGHNLGTLNVIDVRPREVTDADVETLQDLASIVMDELELRLAAMDTLELESLRRAATFRDAIVAGISHEMRTPVAVMRGATELLRAPELSEDELARVKDVLRRQVTRMDQLVEHYLAFGRLEHGGLLQAHPRPTDVQPLLEEAVDLHADQGHVELAVADDVPLAMIDPRLTLHIVCELVGNALRVSSDPDSVSIAAVRSGNEVRITVSDRGPGIPDDVRPRLFDKFFQADGNGGSGLGLFVARGFAQAQECEIEVESDLGVGSRFTLVTSAAQPA